jgi:hypothetical protein
MTRIYVSCLLLPAALLLASATLVSAQESSEALPVGTRPPDAAANAIIESMHIPTTTGEPFSAKSVALLTQNRHGSTIQFGFISLVARDASGRMYFENRRPLAPSGNRCRAPISSSLTPANTRGLRVTSPRRPAASMLSVM